MQLERTTENVFCVGIGMVPLEVQQLFPRWVVILNMSIMRSNSALKNASKCHHGEHVVISKQDINKGG